MYDYYRFSGICRGNLDLLTNDYCHWNQHAQHMAGRNITRFMEQNFRFSWCELEAVPFPVGIRAEFNQDGAVICEKDSLQVLKDYLRVYACMNDASEEEVLDYSLSGTLEVGSSTVTVSRMVKITSSRSPPAKKKAPVMTMNRKKQSTERIPARKKAGR